MFHKKYQLPAVQVVKEMRNERRLEGINILKAEHFLTDLYL